MSTFCHGVASAQSLDKSGEIVDIKGLDISSLPSTGILNFEHKSDIPGQICGKILTAKKIFSKEDCSNEHEAYFWNKTKVPFVYITAELLDDYCQSGKDAAGILKYDHDKKDQNKHAILGFSVEGSEIPNSRGSNRMVVARGIARKVTLTASPCNSQALAELLVNSPKSQVKDDFDEIFKSEANAIEMLKSEEGLKIYETFLAKKEAEGPSKGGKPPKNPYDEYQNQGIKIGTTKSGKHVFSHGHIAPYGFNPAEHKEASEFHRHAAVTAKNPKLADNHIERMKQHNNAALSGGRQENRAALSLVDKDKIAQEQGKQQVAKSEKICALHKSLSDWSAPKAIKNAVHFNHAQHGTVSIHKQPNGEFHVKHNGAPAGLKGTKGVFGSAPEAGAHAKNYMASVTSGVTASPQMHNRASPQMPKMDKKEKLKKDSDMSAPPAEPSASSASAMQSGATQSGFQPAQWAANIKEGLGISKAIEAGSYNAAPSTLTNGAAYQTESLSSKSATTGSEDNKFHGTKKKDWNKRAKDDYDRWPHKGKFEKFMAARMPHLALGEIQAIGRTLALKKSFDMEKSLEGLVSFDKAETSLKKSPKIDLVHYSSEPNLKEVDPKFHGKGVDSRTKGRDTWHPHSFYYKAGTEPEQVVTDRAKHKYTTSIDPESHKIYDIGQDKENILANSPNMDSVHEKLKENGYHGFHNNKHSSLSNVIAMYHPLPVQAESGNQNLGSHFLFSAENPMHPHKNDLKMDHKQTLEHLKGKGFNAHEVKGHYGSPETSIMVHGVNPNQANDLHGLASQLGQDSSIYSQGGKHEMKFHHGENAGKTVSGEGTTWHNEKPKDMYTTMPNGKHFTHKFNF